MNEIWVCSIGGITLTGKDYMAIQTNILILFRSIFEPPKPDTTTNTAVL